uniref:BPTI/Kunitz inhibitor domain-containing protein n=1 Tax=Anisakis simplex TaxID=6269 RepID=A0A0M3KG21_ANISI
LHSDDAPKKHEADTAAPTNTYESICAMPFSGFTKEEPDKCVNQTCTKGYECKSDYCCPSKDLICGQLYDSGHELNELSMRHNRRYAFNPKFGVCNRFAYFGRAGNFNNFPNWEACMRFCTGRVPKYDGQ